MLTAEEVNAVVKRARDAVAAGRWKTANEEAARLRLILAERLLLPAGTNGVAADALLADVGELEDILARVGVGE